MLKHLDRLLFVAAGFSAGFLLWFSMYLCYRHGYDVGYDQCYWESRTKATRDADIVQRLQTWMDQRK